MQGPLHTFKILVSAHFFFTFFAFCIYTPYRLHRQGNRSSGRLQAVRLSLSAAPHAFPARRSHTPPPYASAVRFMLCSATVRRSMRADGYAATPPSPVPRRPRPHLRRIPSYLRCHVLGRFLGLLRLLHATHRHRPRSFILPVSNCARMRPQKCYPCAQHCKKCPFLRILLPFFIVFVPSSSCFYPFLH